MRIDASGNVGIGTTAPGRALEVHGTWPQIRAVDDGTTDASISFRTGGTGTDAWYAGMGAGLSDPPNFAIDYYDGASWTKGLHINQTTGHVGIGYEAEELTTQGRLAVNGNVGIGTTGPEARLEVYNPGVVEETAIKVNNQTNSGYASKLSIANATNVQWDLRVGGSGRGDYANSAFAIEEMTTGHAGTRLIVKQDGNVGIGTTEPGVKLDVSGAARVTSSLVTNSDLQVNPTGYNLYLRNIGGTNRIDSYNSPITATVPLSLNALSLSFQIADVVKMTIDGSGNVGIGTTAPGAKLDVNGDIAKQGTIIYGVVAGGTCLTYKINLWDAQTITYGGATCSGATMNELNCPTGTTKWITMKLNNAGTGGEGGICIK